MRRRAAVTSAAGVLVLGSLAAAQLCGLRVNTTPSMPVGVWRVTPPPGDLRRGEVVTVCLPHGDAARLAAERGYVSAGFCPDGREPVIKPVAAVAGDLVLVTRAGVSVNGIDVDGTAPLDRDTAGRPLQAFPAGTHKVQPDQVWLLAGFMRNSFDSRYYGPVPVGSVQSVAHPVWVR